MCPRRRLLLPRSRRPAPPPPPHHEIPPPPLPLRPPHRPPQPTHHRPPLLPSRPTPPNTPAPAPGSPDSPVAALAPGLHTRCYHSTTAPPTTRLTQRDTSASPSSSLLPLSPFKEVRKLTAHVHPARRLRPPPLHPLLETRRHPPHPLLGLHRLPHRLPAAIPPPPRPPAHHHHHHPHHPSHAAAAPLPLTAHHKACTGSSARAAWPRLPTLRPRPARSRHPLRVRKLRHRLLEQPLHTLPQPLRPPHHHPHVRVRDLDQHVHRSPPFPPSLVAPTPALALPPAAALDTACSPPAADACAAPRTSPLVQP